MVHPWAKYDEKSTQGFLEIFVLTRFSYGRTAGQPDGQPEKHRLRRPTGRRHKKSPNYNSRSFACRPRDETISQFLKTTPPVYPSLIGGPAPMWVVPESPRLHVHSPEPDRHRRRRSGRRRQLRCDCCSEMARWTHWKPRSDLPLYGPLARLEARFWTSSLLLLTQLPVHGVIDLRSCDLRLLRWLPRWSARDSTLRLARHRSRSCVARRRDRGLVPCCRGNRWTFFFQIDWGDLVSPGLLRRGGGKGLSQSGQGGWTNCCLGAMLRDLLSNT